MLEALRLCDRCKYPLELEEWAREGGEQYDNALIIQFEGGYSMFIDPISNEDSYRAILCHECAHYLCDHEPWIGLMLKPLRSHSHLVDKIPTLLAEGHQGWDLDIERQENT